jgi:hypothetical protein
MSFSDIEKRKFDEKATDRMDVVSGRMRRDPRQCEAG